MFDFSEPPLILFENHTINNEKMNIQNAYKSSFLTLNDILHKSSHYEAKGQSAVHVTMSQSLDLVDKLLK